MNTKMIDFGSYAVKLNVHFRKTPYMSKATADVNNLVTAYTSLVESSRKSNFESLC